MNLKDALIKAYANQGLALPGKGTKGQSRQVPEAKNSKKMRTVPAVLVSTKTGERHQSQHLLENSAIHNAQTVIRKLRTVPEKSTSHAQGRITHDRPTTQNTVSPTKRSAPPKAAKPLPTQAPLVVIDPSSRCLVKVSGNSALHLLNLDLIVGSRDNITQFANPEVHEMALGLDFGTSCVKAVISDLAADVAYAVPFIRAKGIEAYLLPSRVFESNAQGHSGNGVGFSLNAGEEVFRDLKLNLLGNPDAVGPQIEVIAFLALVIQRTRAWLFHTHKSVYKRVKCLWQLRIGLPAATALDSKYVPLLERVLLAAWKVAAMECPPTRDEVGRIRESVFSGENFDHELEVRVIPEIVAQVFGFVVSSAFDKKADNRFLMVDVGAGTVDSCLFHVKPPRAGQWSFEFYTAVVQPYGVSNLHAHRVDWWLTHLKPVKESLGLSKALYATKFATDLGMSLPSQNRNYFEGVQITGENPDRPDEEFFAKKLTVQVLGKTLWRAWKDGYLPQVQLSKMPMFLCGGGARSDFYLKLETTLQSTPGFSWLSAEPWQLGVPNDLEVVGVDETDYDRLSVAYGLSKLNVGQITQAVPLPKIASDKPQPFTDRYIDKDQI